MVQKRLASGGGSAIPTVLVTGGAGFIGTNFVYRILQDGGVRVVNLDLLTYAGNLDNLKSLAGNSLHTFVRGDIGDRQVVAGLLAECKPAAIVNFAAETHVDRSILGPEQFIQTNIAATGRLLETVREYWTGLTGDAREQFRFLHVSTDEVYGSLGPDEPAFSESSRYAPNSPYAASKAASDHLVRAYLHTYGLPVIVTNCSNNYGPFQFPEKLIPLMIVNAICGRPLPVYGDGLNVRDWLFVGDHCEALLAVLTFGRVGMTYNVGAACERTNREVLDSLCAELDIQRPRADGGSYAEQVVFVKDRPGHDRRYAIDASLLRRELGWVPRESFNSGIASTVTWYLSNEDWWRRLLSADYADWMTKNYTGREVAE